MEPPSVLTLFSVKLVPVRITPLFEPYTAAPKSALFKLNTESVRVIPAPSDKTAPPLVLAMFPVNSVPVMKMPLLYTAPPTLALLFLNTEPPMSVGNKKSKKIAKKNPPR